MIHIVMSLSERFALSMIGERLRKENYPVSDVWPECLEIPTDGQDDIVDSTWYAGQVIQKMADMCADKELVSANDVVIYDGGIEIISVAMRYLLQDRQIFLVEFRDGSLYYQDKIYQPLDLMEHLANA